MARRSATGQGRSALCSPTRQALRRLCEARQCLFGGVPDGRRRGLGPVAKTLFLFALPSLGVNILQSLNGSVNSVWIGRFLGEEALAAEGTDVFVVEPDLIDAEAARRGTDLYVALTRPTRSLTVAYTGGYPRCLSVRP